MKIRLLTLLCLVLLYCLCIFAPSIAHASVAATQSPTGDVEFIADLGLPIADISDPFDNPTDIPWGWCIAEGVLSDLAIDLDNDEQQERLVVYFAPSSETPVSEDDVDDIWGPEPMHPFGKKDLRLAVFELLDEVYVKQADIIIESSLAFYYANIHISVWGDDQKYIYLHRATLRYEDIGCHYNVLSYRNNSLVVELALIAENFPDTRGLFKVAINDSSLLYSAERYGGETLYHSMDFEEYLEQIAIAGRPERVNDHSTIPTATNAIVEQTVAPDQEEDDDFFPSEENEPANSDDELASTLFAQLAVFGITDAYYANTSYCIPVSEIRYRLNTDTGSSSFRMVDYTGIPR